MRHVIIGVGAAGITAAKTIREFSLEDEIIMISEDRYVHSRCMLHKYISHERTEKELNFAGENFFVSHQIRWVKGQKVITIDPDQQMIQTDGGEEIGFDRLLIATGADSFIPPVGQFREAVNVLGLRNLSDAQRIDELAEKGERILIVGSGLVGLDAAYALLERGRQVTVVEMAERILPIQLDETAGLAYQRLFEKAGCRFVLGRKANETHMNDNKEIDRVILDDGTEIECDMVIVAAGVRPAVTAAMDSRIEADRAINVNAYMQTNFPYIYAAGDVTGLSGIWPNAMKQGRTAGYHMCGIEVPYDDVYAMKNTINFYGLPTLSLGKGMEEDGDVVIREEDCRSYKKAIIRNGKLDSILFQGTINYTGIYQYLIKNKIDIEPFRDRIFNLTFGEFFGTQEDGQYIWN